MPEQRCVSCGAVLHGPYCCQCGEKVVRPEDYSVRRFLKEAGTQIFNIDNRLFKSFWMLIKKPGYLTQAYLKGQRKAWLKPVQLFLISNILFFLAQPITHTNSFNTTLNSHLNRQTYSPLIRKIIKPDQIENLSSYERRFNSLTRRYARTFIFLLIPLAAFLMALFTMRKKRYFFEHLIFVTHFLAFFLLTAFTIWNLLAIQAKPLYEGNEFLSWLLATEMGFTVTFGVIFFWYMIPALRRVYGDSLPVAIFKSFALYFLLTFILYQIYRFALFWLVYLQLG